jgi:hypothetical protein
MGRGDRPAARDETEGEGHRHHGHAARSHPHRALACARHSSPPGRGQVAAPLDRPLPRIDARSAGNHPRRMTSDTKSQYGKSGVG